MKTYPMTGGVLAAMLLALAACNTVQGMGEDIESGGQAIEQAGEEAEAEME